nr:hypothetical protein Iba_chr05bCG10260 [Ipomoea batatas]GMD02087.1 hypothetical protein Iba_chr05fCG13280 [Ipomoea batatas]
MCPSLVKAKASSSATLYEAAHSGFRMFCRIPGNVFTEREVIGDLELETQSVRNKTDGESTSSTATLQNDVSLTRPYSLPIAILKELEEKSRADIAGLTSDEITNISDKSGYVASQIRTDPS